MQCNGMGQAWVTKDGSHECSVTEWVKPGLPRMGYHECNVTEWVNHGLPRTSFVYKIQELYKDH